MKIRPVDAADAAAVIALWRDVFPEYGDPTRPHRDPRANIERKLAFGDGLFWLAEVEAEGATRVVATAMAGYDGHRGWIYSIGVAPGWRRQGIARRLLAHAETELRARGCPKINLQVLAAKDESVRFWRAAGYAEDPVIGFGRRLV